MPSRVPFFGPTAEPSITPSYSPSVIPSEFPTNQPVVKPSESPNVTFEPTSPTFIPTVIPTETPSPKPFSLPPSTQPNVPMASTVTPSLSSTGLPTQLTTRQPSPVSNSTLNTQDSNNNKLGLSMPILIAIGSSVVILLCCCILGICYYCYLRNQEEMAKDMEKWISDPSQASNIQLNRKGFGFGFGFGLSRDSSVGRTSAFVTAQEAYPGLDEKEKSIVNPMVGTTKHSAQQYNDFDDFHSI
jgi:hypothetical protein